MPKYRKKPVVIEAVQIKNRMTVETLEGTMTGEPGDWLITGVNGEQYFCKDDIFKKTYELVVEYPPYNPTVPYIPCTPSTPDPYVPPWRIGDVWINSQGGSTSDIYCCPEHNEPLSIKTGVPADRPKGRTDMGSK